MADRPAATNSRKRSKPGRKRRVAGWVLLVIGVLITGVWGASALWSFGFVSSDWRFSLDSGVFLTENTKDTVGPNGWYAYDRSLFQSPWCWFTGDELVSKFGDPGGTVANLKVAGYVSVKFRHMSNLYRLFVIPWPFALASLLGGGWLVWSGRRARRRAMTGMCLQCGYDLSGLGAGAVCPECGTEAAAPRLTQAMADRPATTSKMRKKPGRKRRVAGWVLLVIGVLIAGVWGASAKWSVSCVWRGGAWWLDHGVASYCTDPDIEPSHHWDLSPTKANWQWLVHGVDSPAEDGRTQAAMWIGGFLLLDTPQWPKRQFLATIVLWPFALASLLGGGWLVWSGRRARRRAMTGMCLKCGYDLSGLGAGAVCPECGTEAPPAR